MYSSSPACLLRSQMTMSPLSIVTDQFVVFHLKFTIWSACGEAVGQFYTFHTDQHCIQRQPDKQNFFLKEFQSNILLAKHSDPCSHLNIPHMPNFKSLFSSWGIIIDSNIPMDDQQLDTQYFILGKVDFIDRLVTNTVCFFLSLRNKESVFTTTLNNSS